MEQDKNKKKDGKIVSIIVIIFLIIAIIVLYFLVFYIPNKIKKQVEFNDNFAYPPPLFEGAIVQWKEGDSLIKRALISQGTYQLMTTISAYQKFANVVTIDTTTSNFTTQDNQTIASIIKTLNKGPDIN